MFGLFKQTTDQNAWVAVCANEATIAVARVRRSKDMPPSLELCQLQAVDSISLQGAEIARLTKLHHLDRQNCISTLNLGDYSLLLVEAPDVPAAELRAAIRWRVKDLIDFHIDDAVIDVFDVPNQRATGKNSMMYAVVAKSDRVRQQIDLFTQSGLNLEVIDIPELAIRNIAALLPEDVAGVVMLHLGPGRGLIAITRQATLYLSRRIDIGSEELGDDVDIAGPKLDRIVIEIQRSLDYYESNFSQPAITNVVLTPLPHPVKGIEQYLAGQLGIAVRSLDINALIDSEEPLDMTIQSECLIAIGAALREEAKAL